MQDIVEQIKSAGLFVDSRGNVYGSKYQEYITKNGGLWQKPEELARLLVFLKNKNIRKFLNIGTFNGNTFNFISDYLNNISFVSCITIDPNNFISPNNKKYPYAYINATSDSFKHEFFDFVFIDGDHSYNSVKKDWENVGQYADIIAFHDIDDKDCPGVVKFWKDLKPTVEKDFDIIEYIEPTEGRNLMGIGVLTRKK
jgi:hypothetical protein